MNEEQAGLAKVEIHWEGDSKEVLSSFPDEVKATLGYALRCMQKGNAPECRRRLMPTIGPGVWELKTDDVHTWYRVMYLARIGDVIHVLHCFKKAGTKTPRRDLDTTEARLKTVQQRIREQKK